MDQYRPLAFFGIKVHESHDSVREWVRWCKRQGFGGFNIIIATDCEGRANEQWLQMLMAAYEVALETAREEGLEVWIFDDWGYPSGTAGGLVCTEPSFRLKRMVVSYDCKMQPGDTIVIKVPEKCIAAGILSDQDTYKSLKLETGDMLEYTAGKAAERLVVVSWEYDNHAAKSSCKSYPGDPAMSCIDMLNPKATRRFLEVMHERYYHAFSRYFGTVIKGFFYDEPYVSYAFPWTESLPDEFYRRKGYDLIEMLPKLMVHEGKISTDPMKTYMDDYFDVWTDMVAKNFYGELSRWCRDHGVELSGHMDLDHRLNTLSTISGHFYRNMVCNDRPAIDVIWAQIEPGVFADFPRYAGSVRRLLGLKKATSETFAGMGQGLFADLMRYITDHQVMRGINDFHLMYSNNQPSPGYSESPQMPNHMLQEPFGKLIYERMAKASALASVGTPVLGTALYIPAYDLHRMQLSAGRVGVTNVEKLPWDIVNDIAARLNYMQHDFDYIWDEAIMGLKLVEGGFLTGSGYKIDTILLPPSCTLVDAVREKLIRFHQLGGRIISMLRVNWVLEEEAMVCSDLKDLTLYLKRHISISPQAGITVHIRQDGAKRIYMLLNEREERVEVEISMDDKGSLYEADLVDGSLHLLQEKEPFQFHTVFCERQMKVFIVDQAFSIDVGLDQTVRDESREVQIINWSIQLPDKRIQRLNGDALEDWGELGYPAYSGSMGYQGEFVWDYEEECAVLKAPGLRYHGIVKIDGEEVGKIIFSPYELKLSGLCRGKHKIELIVYNTTANEVCGTYEIQKERYSKRFAHIADHDRKRLRSGLIESPLIFPVISGKNT